MKPHSLQQEIPLVTTSKLSHRLLAGNNAFDVKEHLSYNDQLKEGCRNGLLDKLLPETIETPSSGKKLHLWQIRSGACFLHIELCTFPVVIEKQQSIDSYLFIPATCAN